MHQISTVVLAVFLLMLSALSYAVEPSNQMQENSKFSLEKALLYTYHNNPQIKAARSELKSVQERLPQALSKWQPSITAQGQIFSTDIDGSNFGSAGGGGGATSKDLDLSFKQPIFRGFQTVAQTKAARGVIESQTALLRAKEQSIMLSAATAFVDIVRDQALVRLAQNNHKVLQQELKATRNRFDVGQLTKTDIAQAESRFARAESDIIESKGNLKTTEAVFLRIIGQEPVNLEKPKLEFLGTDTLEDALELSQNNNPQLISALFAERAANSDVDEVFGELLPELGLFGSWNRTYDPQPGLIEEQTTGTIGISATISLYEGGATRSRIRQAKNKVNQRKMEIVETKRQIRQNVTENWENLKTAQSQIKSRNAEVKAATLAEEGVKKEAELGARTVLDTLDAQQELLDARVALVTAERNELVAHFALLQSIGLLTPASLGFKNQTKDYQGDLNHLQWKILDTYVDSVE